MRYLLNHIWINTQTNKLLKTPIGYCKLEIGMEGSLFKLGSDLFGDLCENIWVKYLWKCIYESGIEIKDDIREVDVARE